MAMEVNEMLFMNKGDGENSYVKNAALYTLRVAAVTQSMLYNTVQSFIRENCSSQFEVLNVAELGCSSSPTTFTVMSTVIESTVKNCTELGFQTPEFQFYLNDLVGNDFNTLFKGLSAIQEKFKNVSSFAMGAPGSFYGRLFPRNSIHLLHSSYSVHWLSKVPKLTSEEGLPLNKGKIYISKTSPPAVIKAYLTQFQEDFISFLKCRSTEMVSNGRMVLIIHGRESEDPTTDRDHNYNWEVLGNAISCMVSQGLIDEEKLDSFNIPYYIASKDDVEDLVKKEGSFTTEFIDLIAINTLDITRSTPESRANIIRSIIESIISTQFGEEIMEKIYDKVTEIIVEDSKLGKEVTKQVSIVVVLKKIK